MLSGFDLPFPPPKKKLDPTLWASPALFTLSHRQPPLSLSLFKSRVGLVRSRLRDTSWRLSHGKEEKSVSSPCPPLWSRRPGCLRSITAVSIKAAASEHSCSAPPKCLKQRVTARRLHSWRHGWVLEFLGNG